MDDSGHVLLADVRGYGRLLVDATLGVTDVVEAMHHNISRCPFILGRPSAGRTRGITGLVYRSIRGTTRLAGGALDAVLGGVPPPADAPSSERREAARGILNGVVGDHLAATGNPLAITMSLRRGGRRLDLSGECGAGSTSAPSRRLLVFVHGLCMSDVGWRRGGHDRAEALARALGASAVYLHYNSGQHVSINGEGFARELEALVARWPVPLDAITIVGHSMGGLVARSACHTAAERGHAWLSRLRRMVFVGTPHHGAPLERGGNWLQAAVGVSPYTAALGRLGRLRSAGITDLRHGSLRHEDWSGGDRFADHHDRRRPVPLPAGVECFAIAAALGKGPAPGRRTLGDGLVPVASALGRHRDPGRSLDLPPARCFVAAGTGHLALLHSPEAYAQMRRWLAS